MAVLQHILFRVEYLLSENAVQKENTPKNQYALFHFRSNLQKNAEVMESVYDKNPVRDLKYGKTMSSDTNGLTSEPQHHNVSFATPSVPSLRKSYLSFQQITDRLHQSINE